MRTTIVTGLLGSGKTTFIKRRIQHAGERTVVLVNDFGAAGIDGEIFSAGGIESVELPSGCVCCTLKFDLITTLQRIMKEFSPEHLVIEPSGIASPVGVLEALESAGVHGYSVIGIVDVTEFTELYEAGMYGSFFREQIELSDVVLVNKIDLVDEGKIQESEKLVERINPRAMLFRTINAELSQPLPAEPEAQLRAKGARRSIVLFKGGEHLHFETLSFRLNGNIKFAQFTSFFNTLVQGHFGSIVRAKALLNTDKGPYRLDGVYGKTDVVPFEKDVDESRLVVIGKALDKQAIEQGLFSGEATS